MTAFLWAALIPNLAMEHRRRSSIGYSTALIATSTVCFSFTTGGCRWKEEYFYGYTVERTHQMRSATKSVVSALIGIAIDQHALSGVEEAVIPHMGYATLGNPDPRKMRITVGDFLSMTSGLECDDHDSKSVGREEAIYEKPDWVKATLDLPMIHDPGTDGSYCSGGVAVLGRLTEKVSGLPLADFAQNEVVPVGWTSGPSKLIKTFAGRASGLVAVEDRSD